MIESLKDLPKYLRKIRACMGPPALDCPDPAALADDVERLLGRDAQFVRWSCGCRGLLIGSRGWVLESCSQEPEDYPLSIHDGTAEVTEPRGLVLGRREMAIEDETGHRPHPRLRDGLSEAELKEIIMKDYEPLPYPEVAQLLFELGRLVHDGYVLRNIKGLLGSTWPVRKMLVCLECGAPLKQYHSPACGKRTADSPYVVEDDCVEEEE